MNAVLLKGLVALVPACMLFSGSVVLFFRGKSLCSLLQLLGAGCLVVVVLAHVCEALHLFPWMHWGLEQGIGHYLDLDRKSTRLNSSHRCISYAVFCLKKKTKDCINMLLYYYI